MVATAYGRFDAIDMVVNNAAGAVAAASPGHVLFSPAQAALVQGQPPLAVSG
jgi:hypothetical protein